MKTLTDKQYEEYRNLKKWAKREKVWVSADGICCLKDDIDLPIRKCVAMTALLGMEPTFSCCGFDYHGQPYHKSHQYGEPYIMVRKNKVTEKWLTMGGNGTIGGGWKIRKHVTNTCLIILKVQGNPYWRKRDCIHFAEEVVLGIAWLEKALSGMQEYFLPNWLLLDTNNNYKKNGVKHWQYPPKEPWLIEKSMLDTY